MSVKELFKSPHLPFWLITAALVMGLVLPVLIMDGMFMDGVLYAGVSKNLANGYGSMWFLRFSEFGFAEHTTFHEHPPLIFWIQSLFFRLLGDGIYVERIYSFFCCIVTAFLMVKTWKVVTQNDESLSKMSWMAIILWIITPIAFWSFQHNIQENTMGIFNLLSVFFVLKALHLEDHKWRNLVLAGVMVFCAGFSKGIPGLFTLGAPFFYWLLFRKFSFGKMLIYNGILLVIPALILSLILLIPEANESLSIYYNDRLMGRIEGAHTRDTHFYILERLFWELLPAAIISTLILAVYRFKKINPNINKERFKLILFFVIIGLCGSVPIMLTLVQKTFYFSAALPYFGIAFALKVAPGMANAIANIDKRKFRFKVFKGLSIVMVIGVLIVTGMQAGKVGRSKEIIHDLHLVDDFVPENSIINMHPEMHNDWDLRVYLIRYYNVSMDFDLENQRPYYLMSKQLGLKPDSSYVQIDLPTRKYDLYTLSPKP